MTEAAFQLETTSISKSFAGNPALQDVNITIRGGEIHALLGANGAGKSTLMKILSGAYQADQGAIRINGSEVSIASPADAKGLGIHCVYQEVDAALVPQLSVAENIMLDDLSKTKSGWFTRPKELEQRAKALLERLHSGISVRRKVAELSIAEKQMTLLARIMSQEAKVIIFDEPTAPLSVTETEILFKIMHDLKNSGVACILITHRLSEVIEHADIVTIMRDGKMVHEGSAREIKAKGIIAHMLGKTFEEEFPKIPAEIGENILEVRNAARGVRVKGVDLSLRRGEILSVVGLVGAGKTELARLLSGADPLEAGDVKVGGRSLRLRQPADAVHAGIVSVPEERRKQGIFIQESVATNLSLPVLDKLSRFGFVNRQREKQTGGQIADRLGIKLASLNQLVQYLSGGNQQKVAIGKWLQADADIFIFDEPTKGVDVGAKSDIFRIIGQLAAAGKGILYLTSELDEGIGIGDRIAVMYDGQIVKTFERGQASQEKLLLYASGGQEEL
ncbi:ABC transporter [Paenibacillus sp. CAA11]|uniref:sugar ABC transporter ATP-binding protein n=1 Tax=Paenibacillus sp. CAA11 TaxID=1532905 RepID=UPI000D3BFA58|nr:sugar ABC transporter ATP-binding protein [Paenibacillus sp. CAA11]AWB45021.1 ABC transporter [Paenibacillus sp. CAA11]